jgi:hypothetical protein
MKPWNDREPEHEQPRENPFGRDFEKHEPGRLVERRHEDAYSRPYDRWQPRDYVFYSGAGYHREFIEPYKEPGPFNPGSSSYAGRGPRGYRRSDTRIEEEVNDALTVSPYLDATDIRVTVSRGEVSLDGEVRDRHSKRLAEDVAAGVRGVADVQNRLRVRADREAGGDVRVAGPSSHSGTEGLPGSPSSGRDGRPRARS